MTDTDLNLLFARDPLKLTRGDIDQIILGLRSRRRGFAEKGEQPATKAKRQTKSDKMLDGIGDVAIEL